MKHSNGTALNWVHMRPRAERWIAIVGLAIVALDAVGFPLLNKYWPYRYRNVEPLIETVLASKITIDRYHRIYFPHPGFVAAGLTLRRNSAPGLPPIGSAQELTVQGNWIDLLFLRRRVRLLEVKGLHVVIPPVGSPANHADFPPGSSSDFAGPATPVETLHMQDATLDILRDGGGRFSFPIRDLALHNVRIGQPLTYDVDMQNALPTGRIRAHGSFGPLTPSNLGGTPLSGDFTYSSVNLGEIGKLHGTLSAQGHFAGRLADIEADATSGTPDFAVGTGKPTGVSGSVQATINGLNANVVLHTIEVRIGRTVVHAGGDIMGAPKVTNLELNVDKGHAEDLMRPFLRNEVPLTGPVWLKSHARIAPAGNGAKFLQRLQLDGGFNVPAEKLTNRPAEKSLTAFSERAQGSPSGKEDPSNPQASEAAVVLSSLEGQVSLRNDILSARRLTFQVPGASADLNGTYSFHGGAVNLTGNLKMDSDISHVTTGFKSALLKPFAPFFKRKQAGAIVPIAITGVPGHYQVSQNLLHTK